MTDDQAKLRHVASRLRAPSRGLHHWVSVVHNPGTVEKTFEGNVAVDEAVAAIAAALSAASSRP
jgi:hypothetical protein